MRMLFRFICFLLASLFCKWVIAQEEQILPKAFLTNETEVNEEWIPTLLHANTSALIRLSQFNGFIFSWTPRGEQYSKHVAIDGINWQSKLSGWNSSFSYAGLYKSFRQVGSLVNNETSAVGFGYNGNTQLLSSNATQFRKAIIIGTGFSNSAYVNEVHLQLNTGKMKKGWFFHSNLMFQETPLGLLPNGFKENRGLLLSVDKLLNYGHALGFTFLGDINNQGKVSPAVKEVYALSRQRNYNPSWGWYKGIAMYPNSKQNNAPQFLLRHEKKWEERAVMNNAIALVVGTQQQSSLDWTNTFDPRPDYYKYLPSYVKDSSLSAAVLKYFEQHPNALQYNFDQFEKVNQANEQKRSFYIINARVAELSLLRASTQLKYTINKYWNGGMGLELAKDNIHYYNRLQNLLGGNFFYNYNGWVNDDGFTSSFQNDLLQPDRKVKEGELWGANYALNAITAKYWIQIIRTGPTLETGFGFHVAEAIFSRNGFNKNGLFKERSLGSSEKIQFPSSGFKGQVLYKISGRYYLRSIFFNEWQSPSADAVYLNPSMHPFRAPFLLPELHQGIDLTLFYRGVKLKFELSAYWKQVQNKSEQKMFYHDRYNAFVYGIAGQMNQLYKGLEASLETKLAGLFQFELAFTLGKYRISNNPLYEILLVNDLYKVESGILQLKNRPASITPELIHSFSVQYQPNYNFSFSISGVYASNRYMNHDYFRRSSLVQNNSTLMQWNKLSALTMLPNQFCVNAYLSKTFSLKSANKLYLLRTSLSTRNILNILIPVLAFEQSRFDYKFFDTEKYAPKYLYDQGTTYSLGFQLTIQ